MSRYLIALALVVIASPLAAQVAPGLTNLSLCANRNGTTDITEGTVALPLPTPTPAQVPSEVAVRILPTQPLSLEGVEMMFSSSSLIPGLPPLGLFTIYDEDPTTGLPGAQIANSANITSAPTLPNGLAWNGAPFQPAVMLTQGTPVWISYFDIFGSGNTYGTQNVSGPDLTPYSVGGLLGTGGWSPAQNNERLKIRLLSSSCPQATNASVMPVGTGCPAGAAPTLLTNGLPVVGNANFGFLVNGSLSSLPAALFWAPTADPVGTPVASMGCTLHLDLPGTLALINVGLNPVMTGQTGLTGIASFPFPIPANPALDGFSAAFQGILVDPNGAPTGTPGISISLTPAVVATIGT